jgi:hypothetical protein
VIAVLAAVLDERRPRLAALQRGPHVGERFFRHVGMTHDVVRLALNFFLGKAADLNERRVGVGDVTLRVRGGHQRGVVGKLEFVLRDWLVVSHDSPVKRIVCSLFIDRYCVLLKCRRVAMRAHSFPR